MTSTLPICSTSVWAAIVGMRHKVVHDYMDVDVDIVWNTAVTEIPRLLPLLQQLTKS